MVRDITILSLSRGILGENFIRHELDRGLRRLNEYGITVHFGRHALQGLDYIEKHPEARAQDLLEALKSDTDMILCAIGGDDTYRLLPWLFSDEQLAKAASDKIFLGFSDTTMNHLMLHKVGMKTFYGQSFLADICELDQQILPYTKRYFEELITTGSIARITPSKIWYNSREDFSEAAIDTAMPSHPDEGFQLLRGCSRFEGCILGGCIDTIYDIFDNSRYSDTVSLCAQYALFPSPEDWAGRILLLETSEETPTPEKYRTMIRTLRNTGIFEVISGLLIGKPFNEMYFDDYKKILLEEINNPALPIVANINVGHATPRCIIPFGIPAVVDTEQQEIVFHSGS